MKNIYDLEGNYWEWTAEADDTDLRTYRGGSYNRANQSHWNPASFRISDTPTDSNGLNSARSALYVNL